MQEELSWGPQLPKDKKVPIACIGSGFIMADCHLVAYGQAGFNPVAITSADLVQAREVAERHQIPKVYSSVEDLLCDSEIEVIDVAVPPDVELSIIRQIVEAGHIRGILAQKPLGSDVNEAKEIVALCQEAGIVLAVNQNMRYDQSVRACKDLLDRRLLGDPVFASIDMRAIPHWMPWQERQGWCTLRIMSIHHLDTFRFWFGDPDRIFTSTIPDPRTEFTHSDGICLYILEYEELGLRASSWDDVWAGPAREGAAADISIRWRVEGTEGMARGTIGWPSYPERTPSTIDYTLTSQGDKWFQPRWNEVWFPDAFVGPMSELLVALETGASPSLAGADNIRTMALVEAAYESARTHQAVNPSKWYEKE